VPAGQRGLPDVPGEAGHGFDEALEAAPAHEEHFGVRRDHRHRRRSLAALEQADLAEDLTFTELPHHPAPYTRSQVAGQEDVEAVRLVALREDGLPPPERPHPPEE